MSEVTVTARITIQSENMIATDVWRYDSTCIWIRQGDDNVLINPAAVPALTEALQVAAKEAGNECDK